MTLWTNCIQLGSYIRLLQYLVIATTCGKTGGNTFCYNVPSSKFSSPRQDGTWPKFTITSIFTFSQIRWYQVENLITVNEDGPF